MTEYKIDPITLEVVRHKLDGIANEMELNLLRSSFSPIVKEGLDASASLFTIKGETLAQACSVPIHLATLIPVVNAILSSYPLESMKDGDVYIMNDPYLGGTHLPDIALVAPVFGKSGKPIAITATMAHHQDVGGMSPGSIPTHATEIFQEGLRIPPLKFYDGGELNTTLDAMLRLNVRVPEMLMGDLHAQIAGCKIGIRRLSDLEAVYGADELSAMFEALLDHSEHLTVDALRTIPEGQYRYTGWLDNDGIDLDKPVKIQVAVNVQGGKLHVDFSGTSAQVRGPFNCVASGSHAAVYFAVRTLTNPDIPTNGGCFRCVTVTLPEGTLVNPRAPAPVCARTATIKRISATLLAAFKDVLDDKVGADSASTLTAVAFGGLNEEGKPFVVSELIAGGNGASREGDGVDVIETDASNCMNYPAEAIEMNAPVRVRRMALRTGSGGDGTHRGGLGIIKEFEMLADGITMTHRGEGHRRGAEGAAGGAAGQVAVSQIVRNSGQVEEIKSKIVTTLSRGDRLIVQTAGGGGWGKPSDRDDSARREDQLNGKV
ncbi:5-oxoprolinase [Burkholderia multivorans]|uniref:hydantoinase B/oxoprolinase family protein n=1 Tax=Burkholderia multivorans TaxID=87883 RepID=UPI000D00ABE3|nr:hydantoinase B/oxoprolinase family protein [Burkholderia multivorans]PRG59741.1 5-oxoprolinase [Burkholderia multivorans]